MGVPMAFRERANTVVRPYGPYSWAIGGAHIRNKRVDSVDLCEWFFNRKNWSGGCDAISIGGELTFAR